jgi:hypothetical protein
MARSSNQAAAQIPATAPRSEAEAAEQPNDDAPEAGSVTIPWQWRMVFRIWAVCFAIMVLYEVSVLIGKLFM